MVWNFLRAHDCLLGLWTAHGAIERPSPRITGTSLAACPLCRDRVVVMHTYRNERKAVGHG